MLAAAEKLDARPWEGPGTPLRRSAPTIVIRPQGYTLGRLCARTGCQEKGGNVDCIRCQQRTDAGSMWLYAVVRALQGQKSCEALRTHKRQLRLCLSGSAVRELIWEGGRRGREAKLCAVAPARSIAADALRGSGEHGCGRVCCRGCEATHAQGIGVVEGLCVVKCAPGRGCRARRRFHNATTTLPPPSRWARQMAC